MAERDDLILGGDTPFVPASEAYRAFGPTHRPTAFSVDGKETTRDTLVTMCAVMQALQRINPRPLPISDAEYMRQFIAGANHDLRALGLHPLISIQEVDRLSRHPQIVAAAALGAEGSHG